MDGQQDVQQRPWRSALYIPGSRPRALEKALTLACDAIIFDLEDAVTPEEKVTARETLVGTLRSADYGRRGRIVRVNGLDTPWGANDLAACAGLPVEAVLLPKVSAPADLDAAAARLADLPLWAMMETPAGMLNAAAIAAHPRLEGMVMGTNDLAKDLGARFRRDRLPLATGLGLCLLAARAHGLVILDGVYNAFRDAQGLAAECAQGRDMGFDGKTLIHPDQIAVANTAFSPDAAEIALARRQIAAYDAARAAGQGVAVVDGRIVENLHIVAARRTLAQAEAIAAMHPA
jgi:(3S)-malyl-CoA thioesterase